MNIYFDRVRDEPLQTALPQRATPRSLGYDLYSTEYVVIPPGQTRLMATNLRLAAPPPDDLALLVLPRSSLIKKGLIIPNSPGLIDPDYTGEIKILLHNIWEQEWEDAGTARIEPGERLGQLLFVRVELPELDWLAYQERTERGGFGSTGA